MQSNKPYSQSDGPRLTPVESGNEQFFMSEQAEQGGLSILDHWRIVRRYKWSILAMGIIAGLVGTFHALSATSIYQARARLWVIVNQPNMSVVNQFEAAPLYWLYFQTQSEIIKSRAVAELVVERLGLEQSAEEADLQVTDRESAENASLSARTRDWAAEMKSWLPEELRSVPPAPLDKEGRHAALVSSVLGGVSVSGGTESEVLIVSYTSADPQEAAELTNAFAEAYIDFGRESRVSNVQKATSWLGRRIEELRKKAIASEGALREFQARENLVDTEKREQIISAKLGTLTAELIKAQSRRGEAEALYMQIKSTLDSGKDYESVAGNMTSAAVLEAHRIKTNKERIVAELSERYGHKHPKMRSAQADLQGATRRLKMEVGKAVDGARKKFELAVTQEQQFRNMIKQQQNEMRAVGGKAFELKQLEQEVEANRTLYETYLDRFKESDVADEYDAANARIIDRAMVPTTPFKPDRMQMVIVAVVVGLGIGILMAFVREHLSNTFKTKEGVEEKLGLPVIGVIPRVKTDSTGESQVERRVLMDPHSPFAEAINEIRTAILFSHIDKPSKVVLVTSAVPGEGKTTLVSNLALAFCRRGRTLLIDADLRKGRFQKISNLKDHPGLTDMLSGACTPKDAIVPDSEADNLFLLMPGTAAPNPLEIVSSKRFSDELAKLRDNFDYIVIDTTPLLPVSDSIVLSRLADAVVLAIKTDSSSCDAILDGLKRLQAARVKPVGVVMQQADLHKIRSYGRHYTAAYNGYYAYYSQKQT
jgi:capsular exopolysaccharide synthesis family protein